MDVEYFILGFAVIMISIITAIIFNFIMDRRRFKKIIKWLKSEEAVKIYQKDNSKYGHDHGAPLCDDRKKFNKDPQDIIMD
jgi:predicted transcriptional regulator